MVAGVEWHWYIRTLTRFGSDDTSDGDVTLGTFLPHLHGDIVRSFHRTLGNDVRALLPGSERREVEDRESVRLPSSGVGSDVRPEVPERMGPGTVESSE